jgi:predicted ATP-dependent endonuclease of OLD family
LLALLQELAAVDGDAGPALILGVEEPELYQHPPQARYLSQTLQKLASIKAQVIVTTHSPYFIGGTSFENVRLVRKAKDACATSTVLSLSFHRYAKRYAGDGDLPRPPTATEVLLNEALRSGLNEMFFATKLVLVEGSEDVAYLLTWAALTGRLSHFRSQGVHVVSVEGKQNLAPPIIIAQELHIPLFVVFDGDKSKADDPKQIAHNRRLLRLLGAVENELFPIEDSWNKNFLQWSEMIGEVVESELVASLDEGRLASLKQEAMLACGHAPSLKKNSRFIEELMWRAYDAGARCESLDRLCDTILAL